MSKLYRFTENGILRDHAWGTDAEAARFAEINGYLYEIEPDEAAHGPNAEHLDDMLARGEG